MKNLANRIRKLEKEANPTGEKWFVIKGSKDCDWSKVEQEIAEANPDLDLNFIHLIHFGEYMEAKLVNSFWEVN